MTCTASAKASRWTSEGSCFAREGLEILCGEDKGNTEHTSVGGPLLARCRGLRGAHVRL